MNDKLNLVVAKVKQALLPPRMLLSKFRFIDEASRYSRACLDHHYLPFYYYLGVYWPVKNLLEIGFGLGLNAAMYLLGNKEVENYLTIQEPLESYYSARMGRANIKQVYRKPFVTHVGKLHDEAFVNKVREHKWDLVLINEKREYDVYLSWLHFIWEELADDGLVCMEYTKLHEQAGRAYRDFCIIKNREQFVLPTRYSVGVISK